MKEEKRIPLTDSEKGLAKEMMMAACCLHEMKEGHRITDIKEAEYVLQDALEDFAKNHLKDPHIVCWWQLTNHEDVFNYMFGINTKRHTLCETIGHFASILSRPA